LAQEDIYPEVKESLLAVVDELVAAEIADMRL
jgi:hypothetical protein